jgi:hypothetical protein
MTTTEFPNMFWLYGPQSPSSFANAPTCVEIQGKWIADLMIKMRKDGNTLVETTKDAEENWVKKVGELWSATLCPGTESWYQGSNIPGKVKEPLICFCGIPAYIETLDKCKDSNYPDFTFA